MRSNSDPLEISKSGNVLAYMCTTIEFSINQSINQSKKTNNQLELVSVNTETLAQNWYLNYLIDLTFQGVNIVSVLLYGNNTYRKGHTRSGDLKIETKDYNGIIDGPTFFNFIGEYKYDFLCRLVGPLMKVRLPAIKNVRLPLAKSVLIH